MVELTRTLQQWWATARRLEHETVGRPDLAEQIRWAFPSTTSADPDTPLTVLFTSGDAAVIEQRAPLSAWWMPPTRGWMRQPRLAAGRAQEAVAAAEAIIRDHQRRRHP